MIQSILHRLLDMVKAMLWLFIDDVAAAGSSRMNSNVYRDILDHTNGQWVKTTQEFLKAKTRILQWPEENRKKNHMFKHENFIQNSQSNGSFTDSIIYVLHIPGSNAKCNTDVLWNDSLQRKFK